jgi:hypothetical protein
MRAFICSLLGHRFSWILERRTGVVTAVCRRCKRPILCPYPKAEPDNAVEARADASSP